MHFLIGEQGGTALANVLFGKVNPSGKLSVSFPTYVGSLPSYYNYNKGGRTLDPGHVYSVRMWSRKGTEIHKGNGR